MPGRSNICLPCQNRRTGKDIDFTLASLFAFTKVGNAVTFPEGSMMGYYDDLKKMADSIDMSSDVLKNTMEFSDSIVAAILRWSKKDNYAQTRTAERYTVLYNVLAVGYQHHRCMAQQWNHIGMK